MTAERRSSYTSIFESLLWLRAGKTVVLIHCISQTLAKANGKQQRIFRSINSPGIPCPLRCIWRSSSLTKAIFSLCTFLNTAALTNYSLRWCVRAPIAFNFGVGVRLFRAMNRPETHLLTSPTYIQQVTTHLNQVFVTRYNWLRYRRCSQGRAVFRFILMQIRVFYMLCLSIWKYEPDLTRFSFMTIWKKSKSWTLHPNKYEFV